MKKEGGHDEKNESHLREAYVLQWERELISV